MNVICYRRVSTSDQDAGLEAQRSAIDAYLLQRGWALTADYVEKQSAKDMDRPELQRALAHVEGDKGVLIVSKLDRLSRSVADFASLAERARKRGWSIVALDLGLDMTSPTGELIANIMSALSQWERKLIGQRTRDAMAVKRSQGVHCGRRRQVPDDVVAYIRGGRKVGMTYKDIGAALELAGVRTVTGNASWAVSTLRRIA